MFIVVAKLLKINEALSHWAFSIFPNVIAHNSPFGKGGGEAGGFGI
jgi:hypothetical protein